MEFVLGISVVLGFLLIVGISMFNRLVRLRATTKESYSNLEVALKRRHDLIPNLVEVVKAFAAHERQIFEDLVKLRNQAQAHLGQPQLLVQDENQIMRGTRALIATAESYPELKSSQHFLNLQQELVDAEDTIAIARRFYNSNVKELNTSLESFPSNLVATMAGIRRVEYFNLDDAREAHVPSASIRS